MTTSLLLSSSMTERSRSRSRSVSVGNSVRADEVPLLPTPYSLLPTPYSPNKCPSKI
ncbi:MAG: hypothetical protein AAF810_24490 [Cyanobacteria bacterium P01_D01_bin.36]